MFNSADYIGVGEALGDKLREIPEVQRDDLNQHFEGFIGVCQHVGEVMETLERNHKEEFFDGDYFCYDIWYCIAENAVTYYNSDLAFIASCVMVDLKLEQEE